MKIEFKKAYMALALGLAVSLGAVCSSCGDDDDDPVAESIAPAKYQGTSFSTIPAQPQFEGSTSDNYVSLNWANPEKTKLIVYLGGYSVTISETMNMSVTVGDMNIINVPCTQVSDGYYTFSLSEFSCQAGDYEANGSIEGSVKAGKLECTVLYSLASMPFQIKSVYQGTKQ